MKYLLLFLSLNLYAKEPDVYVIPQDIIEARDKALISLEKFKNTLLSRYIVLSKKQKLSLAEEREFAALDAIILNKDLNKVEEDLMEMYRKKKPLKKLP